MSAYKAIWKEKAKGFPPLKARPKINGRTLVDSLERLAEDTGDERFRSALQAIEDLNLIDPQGHFRRDRRVHPDSLTHQYSPDNIFDLVEKLVIECGASLNQAYAHVVAEWGEPASSFETAVQRIERLYKLGEAAVYPLGPPKRTMGRTKRNP